MTIPNSVTSIGDQAFWYCAGVTNISVAADNPSYSSVNGVLFDKTQAMLIRFPEGQGGNYIIPNSVSGIGFGAFFSCYRVSNATIPNSVTSIGDYAFQYCWGLTNVTIPSSVTSIGDWAFSYCSGLTNITCKGDAPALGGGDAFSNVHASAKVYYFPGTSGWGPTYGGLPTILVEDFTYETNGGALTITAYTGPGGAVVIPATTNGFPIVSIGSSAFYGRTDVTSVTIPNSVTSIGGNAFAYCSGLTSVTIGNGVTSIGDAAFAHSGLTSVTIPNSVTSIGTSAFEWCTSLSSATIPNSVTSIGAAAFYRCSSLTSVSIPDGVTSIAPSVFYGCTSLTSATIGNGVTSIGHQAFAGTGLTSVTIPDSVTSIGGGAFDGSTGLTSVTIPNSVTGIGWSAFRRCTSLTGVIIPNSVTSIEDWAFEGCTNLTNFTFLGNAPELIFYPTHPDDYSGDWFSGVGAGAAAYYYCGTTGWGATYGGHYGRGGLPTVMLIAPRVAPGSAGVKPGGFGFTLTCLTNQTIVVEASANLVNWQPIWTNTLSGASADFVDPEWFDHPIRFYRARSD